MMEMLRGVAYVLCGGKTVLGVSDSFRQLFQTEIFRGIRLSMLYMFLLAIVYGIILTKTRIGVYIYAIGSNEEATKLSGINVDKYKTIAYAMCGIGGSSGWTCDNGSLGNRRTKCRCKL